MAFELPLPSELKVSKLKVLDARKNTSDLKHRAENHSTRNLKNDTLNVFSQHFDNSLGIIKGQRTKTYISTVVILSFRPMKVSLALQDQVSVKLTRLVNDGVSVQYSIHTTNVQIFWVSLIVVTLKSKENIRICADFTFEVIKSKLCG